MRLNSQDATIKRNYLQKYRFLIKDYESVKNNKHPKLKLAKEFYEFHDVNRRTFLKYYNRYKQTGKPEDLLPRKRGPKWKTRRIIPYIEQKVIELRHKGMNRYEVVSVLKSKFKQYTPSPSGVYNIFKRTGLNKLNKKMEQSKRKIIKEKAGELGHIDTHYLSKCLIQNENKTRYLVCVVDSCTRIAWAEVVEDIKALTVMFCALRIFNIINANYDIQFSEVLSDNGPEFGSKNSKNKQSHPFERMLIEMGIKHRYIMPYRPQTNGKVERFWRTLEEDLLRETTFDNLDELKKELEEYLYYYNHERPHQGLSGNTPVVFNQSCPRIM